MAAGGYTARLRVPPGSLVLVRGAEESDPLPPVSGADLSIRFPSTRGGPPPQLTVVTPAGRGYRAAWRVGRVVGAPPGLSVSVSAGFLAGVAQVRGSTAHGACVSVDGRSVPTGAEGAFSTRVEAGLWPRSVSVTASDVLGQTSTTTLTVVGYLDYPGLPWLPMVSLSLLGLAGFAAWRQRPGMTTLRADALVEVEPGAAASALTNRAGFPTRCSSGARRSGTAGRWASWPAPASERAAPRRIRPGPPPRRWRRRRRR